MLSKTKWNASTVVTELFLLALAAVWIVPAAAAVQTSLGGRGFANYTTVLTTQLDGMYMFLRMFLNSTFITGATILLIFLCAIPGAYAFSKFHFRGKIALYMTIVSCFAIPIICTLIPNSVLITELGLRNTYASMIVLLVTANIPLALLILKGNFDGISNTYIEAATLDGSSNFQTMTRIMLPMAKPAIVNVLIVLFIQVWNDFQIPLIFAGKPELYTLTLAPSFFGLSQNRLELPPLYASIILIAIPVVAVYMLMQDKIVKGMALGGIKE